MWYIIKWYGLLVKDAPGSQSFASYLPLMANICFTILIKFILRDFVSRDWIFKLEKAYLLSIFYKTCHFRFITYVDDNPFFDNHFIWSWSLSPASTFHETPKESWISEHFNQTFESIDWFGRHSAKSGPNLRLGERIIPQRSGLRPNKS